VEVFKLLEIKSLLFFTGHLHAICHPFFVVYIELHHHLCLKTLLPKRHHIIFAIQYFLDVANSSFEDLI